MGQGIGSFVVFLIVSLLGMLWLGQTLSRYQGLEIALMVALAVIGIIALLGIAAGASWSWPLAVLFFGVSAANVVLVYHVGREAFLEVILLLGWTVLGLMHASIRIGSRQTTLQQYSTMDDVPMQLENIMPTPKPSRLSARPAKRKAKSRKSR